MSSSRRRPARWPKNAPLKPIPTIDWLRQRPTFREASPAIIDAALRRSQRRPSGNWYAFAASTSIRADRPFGTTVGGVELVAWRDEQHRLRVGPGACPHLGAALDTAYVSCGTLVCRWHGLRLGNASTIGWKPLPSYDDGVLAWIRLDALGGEEPLDRPVVPAHPANATRRLGRMMACHGIRTCCWFTACSFILNRFLPNMATRCWLIF